VVVVSEPCPDLVALVERGVTSGEQLTAAVERHVRVLLKQQVDTIVLGCTHFQFLREVVAAVTGATKQLALAHDKGPHFADPLKSLGDAPVKQGHPREAIVKYDEALKYAPHWAGLREASEAAARQKS
jgi:glutamate racemase